ncbi:MAG: SpoIID/LytB domain-containing protein, partial [bacterium]
MFVLTCKAPLYNGNGNDVKPPVIRVGILEQRNSVEFHLTGKVSFMNRHGSFALRNLQGGHWRVEVEKGQPAEFIYRLAIGTTKDRFKAEEIVRSAYDKGLNAQIKKYGRTTDLSLPYFQKSVYQVLLDKEFRSEDEAKIYQKTIQEKTGSEIIVVPIGVPQGTLRFTNLDNQYSFDSKERIRLSTNHIEIIDVDVGSGFHWESRENRIYNGTLEFVLDNFGLITVVNELSIEEYLKGVVPSEMPVGFPFEALKAQAVAARVEALAKIGLRHPLEPFDLCDDVHCQVFSGRSRLAESTNRAVESTRGIFMIYRKKIIEAFYAAVCGGHTENNENVWLMDAKPYLRGVLDRGGKGSKRLSTSLAEEMNVKKWIDSSPEVFCNTTRKKVPEVLNYSKKYFRWQVPYARKELEGILRNKTGEDFGLLLDLVPIKRGISGRLIELEVVGTKKRFIIRQELAIRQALSKNTL